MHGLGEHGATSALASVLSLRFRLRSPLLFGLGLLRLAQFCGAGPRTSICTWVSMIINYACCFRGCCIYGWVVVAYPSCAPQKQQQRISMDHTWNYVSTLGLVPIVMQATSTS